MTKGETVALVAAGLAAVGGVGYIIWRSRQQVSDAEQAAAALARAGATPPVQPPKQKAKMDLATAIATLGGKLVSEGAKFLTLGGTGYAAEVASRRQVAA